MEQIASIEDSSVVLQGHVTFLGNNASSGGAIALMGNRTIWFPEPDDTLITFANNLAVDNGGALYFSAPSYFMCLYNVPSSLNTCPLIPCSTSLATQRAKEVMPYTMHTLNLVAIHPLEHFTTTFPA